MKEKDMKTWSVSIKYRPFAGDLSTVLIRALFKEKCQLGMYKGSLRVIFFYSVIVYHQLYVAGELTINT